MNDEYVGIDAGGTLSKIVHAEGRELGYKVFPTLETSMINQWIRDHFDNPKIHITGGKAGYFAGNLSGSVTKVNEFQATCEGVKWLLEKEGLLSKSGPKFVVANVGTGTSIHYVNGESYERIGGSGIGGGTLLGLTYLLTGEDNFDTILQLGQKGNGQSLNIKVGDIYSHETPPISGDLTASNFGNVDYMKKNTYPKEDSIAAVIRMIGETITTMSVQAADRLKTESIIYIGSTFTSNNTLTSIIKEYTRLRGKEAYFLKHGEFSGAIGALLNQGLRKAWL